MINQEEFQKRYRYEIANDRLGEGGFGEVFKAYDTFLDRWVAIKVSKVKADFPELRLRNEVALVNKLPAHPNIARYEECYSFNTISGEHDFGILQYYELGNLLQLLQTKPLSLNQRYTLLANLLEGIRFIHSQNIIHRDIKPQNILIVNREENYIPKITDFGISKRLKPSKGTHFSNSLIGAGTIAYSSPEQLADHSIRKNTDLWSFGVIAFQVLTGELPFNSGSYSTSSELGRQEILKQIHSGKLPQNIDQIAVPWRTVIEKCLIIDYEKRIKEADDCIYILSGQKKQVSTGSAQMQKIKIEDDKTQIVSTTHGRRKLNFKWGTKRQVLLAAGGIIICILVVVMIYFLPDFPPFKGNNSGAQKSDTTFNSSPIVEPQTERLQVAKDSSEAKVEFKKVSEKIVEKKPDTLKTTNPITFGKISFPNGNRYEGALKNGQMHGKGKYWFNARGMISKDDPMERIAEAGDFVEGDWIDGELYKGYHFDKNGIRKERIVIGRN
jgi:serine/threonine protein kinase